jgi:hypothetical protein
MKIRIVGASLLLLVGCQRLPPAAPVQPITIYQATSTIKSGTNQGDVIAMLGQPWRSEGGSTTDPDRERTTYFDTLYWHVGKDVARIDLVNHLVTTVSMRRFPTWAVMGFGYYGGTSMSAIRKQIGPPSRTAKHVENGQRVTYWVYTDKTGSEKTLLIVFNAKGYPTNMGCFPNREDLDDYASFQPIVYKPGSKH